MNHLNSVITHTDIKNLKYDVLDHGFIRVVDVMGNDERVVQSARVSYGAGTKSTSEDKGLINYLVKHKHTTPLEQCLITIHCKLPLFVFAQWVRHRTWKFNCQSYRYSEAANEFYIPENWRKQSSKNKQCSSSDKIENHDFINDTYNTLLSDTKKWYDYNIGTEGVAREMARISLPQSLYTEFYGTVDLHNLLHFISLRDHKHAQYEIRVYAEKLGEIVKQWCPMVWEAFEEHRLNAATLSRSQLEVIKNLLNGTEINEKDAEDIKSHGADNLSKRELNELKEIFDI